MGWLPRNPKEKTKAAAPCRQLSSPPAQRTPGHIAAEHKCVAQDFAEETQEFQQGIDDQRFRRRAQAPPARAAPTPQRQRPPFPAAEVLKLYVACLHAGLQARRRPAKLAASVVPETFPVWPVGQGLLQSAISANLAALELSLPLPAGWPYGLLFAGFRNI